MNLKVQLNEFAESIRNTKSDEVETPDTKRRMDIYRSLFFNNVAGFIQNGFPVLYSLYSDDDWQVLIRRFFKEHECTSPYFIHISKEFVEYLSNEYQPMPVDPPFMMELAHYEWLELALAVREPEQPFYYWQGDEIPARFRASPLSEVAAYHYPVHQISVDYQPEQSEQQHYYLLYRDVNHQVQFQHIAPLSAMAMELLLQQSYDVELLISAIHQLAPQFSRETLEQGIMPLLKQWLACGAIVESAAK